MRVEEAAELARDSVVAIGGGSTIDLGKAISATARVPLISVPTTYSGAEWTPYFGVRDPERRMRGGGSGARLAGIVYDVGLTVGLPREETVGTSMNALAHCAEALYAHGHNPESDEQALEGAQLISEFLPRVVGRAARPRPAHRASARCVPRRRGARRLDARARARDGAGRRRQVRPSARDAERHLPPARAPLQRALRAGRGARVRRGGRRRPGPRVEELTALGGITRLRELGVPEEDLPELAASAAQRGGNQANPHPATPTEIEELLRSVW